MMNGYEDDGGGGGGGGGHGCQLLLADPTIRARPALMIRPSNKRAVRTVHFMMRPLCCVVRFG